MIRWSTCIAFSIIAVSGYVQAATQAELLEQAQQSAKQISGQMQISAPADNFDADEEYKKYGVENMSSTGSLLSTNTKISATLSASKQFHCTDGKSVSAAYLKVTFNTCDISGSNFNITYCPSLDGRDCTVSNQRTADLTMGVKHTFDSINEIKIASCVENLCILEILHTPVDEFSGDLEAEAELRDSTNPSAATEASLSHLNNPLLDEFKAEADDTADYANRASESVETTGEMPIYRNSPSDIALLGNRNGSIAFDANAAAGGQICTDDVSASTPETCYNTFNATEFVCDEPAPVCSYQRHESTVIDCGRKLSIACDRSGITSNWFNYAGNTLPANYSTQSEILLVGKTYTAYGTSYVIPAYGGGTEPWKGDIISNGSAGFTTKWMGPTTIDDDPWRRPFDFFISIKNVDNVTNLFLPRSQHDDIITIAVNGTPIYSHPTPSGVPASCLPLTNIEKIFHPKLPWRVKSYCSNGSSDFGTFNDTKFSVTTPNIDIKPYLKNGLNKISIVIYIRGKGSFSVNWRPVIRNPCSWVETWEPLPCAM